MRSGSGAPRSILAACETSSWCAQNDRGRLHADDRAFVQAMSVYEGALSPVQSAYLRAIYRLLHAMNNR